MLGILAALAGLALRWRLSDSRRRTPQDFGAALKSLSFLLGHIRLKDFAYALPAEHAGERNGDGIFRVVRADRNDGVLVA
jgi:hypothetical protein